MKPLQKFRKVNKQSSKWIKLVSWGLLIVVPVGFIGAFAYRRVDASINFEGSSAVKPLVDALANNYLHTHKDVDIFVQAGGSGTGLNRVLSSQTNFGNYSDFTEPAAQKPQNASLWKNLQIKTITLAWDAIGLLYKRPHNCAGHVVINSSTSPIMYGAFSGSLFNSNQAYTLNQLMPNLTTEQQDSCAVPISAYARSGGGKKSGTAEAFLSTNQSYLKKEFAQNHPDQLKRLENGNYGNQSKVVETAESNSASWAAIQSDNLVGSMIYLSAGFIFQNWSQILQSGFELAGFQGKDQSEAVFLTPETFQQAVGSTYKWFRPLNTLVSLKEVSDPAKAFINWALNPKQKKIIQNLGFIPLNTQQQQSMGYSETNLNQMWYRNYDDVSLGYYGAKTE